MMAKKSADKVPRRDAQVRCSPEVRIKLNVYAAQKDVSAREIVDVAILEYLKKRGA